MDNPFESWKAFLSTWQKATPVHKLGMVTALARKSPSHSARREFEQPVSTDECVYFCILAVSGYSKDLSCKSFYDDTSIESMICVHALRFILNAAKDSIGIGEEWAIPVWRELFHCLQNPKARDLLRGVAPYSKECASFLEAYLEKSGITYRNLQSHRGWYAACVVTGNTKLFRGITQEAMLRECTAAIETYLKVEFPNSSIHEIKDTVLVETYFDLCRKLRVSPVYSWSTTTS